MIKNNKGSVWFGVSPAPPETGETGMVIRSKDGKGRGIRSKLSKGGVEVPYSWRVYLSWVNQTDNFMKKKGWIANVVFCVSSALSGAEETIRKGGGKGETIYEKGFRRMSLRKCVG